MRAGAVDFVVKPASPERLEVSMRSALKIEALAGEITRIKKRAEGTLTFSDLIIRGDAMSRVIALGKRAAASNIPVLIEGESGVGKELIARAVQGESERRSKPFVTVNCGAIPENLVESILFGHEKGAFTGATDKRVGKFQEADGGTLFLDEVGELPPAAQVKGLRALQEGEVEPVGSRKTVKVDVRIVSATNRDLIADVKAGRFREDLFYRLCVFPITIPPLRKRPEDIPELVRHFLTRIAAEQGKRLRALDGATMAQLAAFRWPGNVRQLENAIFRAVVLADGDSVGMAEFPQVTADPAVAPMDHQLEPMIEASPDMAPDMPAGPPLSISDRMARLKPGVTMVAPSLPLTDSHNDVRPLEDIERDAIRFAIAHYRGQMSEVARKLKIGRSTLYRKLEGLGLEEEAAEVAVNETVASE
jgi:DNA-binding NtrC family response regulator